jgi:hypothetical protein
MRPRHRRHAVSADGARAAKVRGISCSLRHSGAGRGMSARYSLQSSHRNQDPQSAIPTGNERCKLVRRQHRRRNRLHRPTSWRQRVAEFCIRPGRCPRRNLHRCWSRSLVVAPASIAPVAAPPAEVASDTPGTRSNDDRNPSGGPRRMTSPSGVAPMGCGRARFHPAGSRVGPSLGRECREAGGVPQEISTRSSVFFQSGSLAPV